MLGDTRRPEVVADLGEDPGGGGPLANNPVGIGLARKADTIAGKL